MAQARGVQLGMTFLDGSNVRAHQQAAGAAKKGAMEPDVLRVRLLVDLVVAPVRFADISPRDRASARWDKSLRDRRRQRSCHRLQPDTQPGARTAAGDRPACPSARRATLGGGRSRLHQPRLQGAHLEPSAFSRRLIRSPKERRSADRRGGSRPVIPPQRHEAPVACLAWIYHNRSRAAPSMGRTLVGQAQGGARHRHPLREDRPLLHGRPLPRRLPRLAQELTGPSGWLPFGPSSPQPELDRIAGRPYLHARVAA